MIHLAHPHYWLMAPLPNPDGSMDAHCRTCGTKRTFPNVPIAPAWNERTEGWGADLRILQEVK